MVRTSDSSRGLTYVLLSECSDAVKLGTFVMHQQVTGRANCKHGDLMLIVYNVMSDDTCVKCVMTAEL